MALGSTHQRESLKRWTALAFGVAAVAGIGNEVLTHLGTAQGAPAPEWALDLTLVLTFGGALVGLLGIYAMVTELSPRLSRVGLLAVGLTGGSIIASIVGKFLVGGESPQGILLVIPLTFYMFSTLSFLIFGIASLRTHVPSRTVGYLLLTVVVSRVITVAGMGELGSALFILPLLGIGYLLQGKTSQPLLEVLGDEASD
jgi:hypothetical protein